MTSSPKVNLDQAPRTVSLRAHAKLNLALAIDRPISSGERRGYHPIASWMTPIDLAESGRTSLLAVQQTIVGSEAPRPSMRLRGMGPHKADWVADPPTTEAALADAAGLEARWSADVANLGLIDRRPRWLRHHWSGLDRAAAMPEPPLG